MLTAERLRDALDYDPETGAIKWLEDRNGGSKAGAIAGCILADGYRQIMLGRKRYLAHRLAWLYVTGEWPDGEVDHINGDRDDNRLANLRLATHAENQKNYPKPRTNTSGVKGVHWSASRGKWIAKICVNYRRIFLGQFDDINEAAAAYAAASAQYHGEFGRAA